MNQIFIELGKMGIVPVIALNDAKDAAPLAKALCDGGLPCAEVTFRTAAAEESIRIMTSQFPDMLVGAGTVLTIEQVDKAIKAGARFIVSPGLNPKVVKYCVDNNITIIPGCSSPTDIEQAIELGLDVVKFFPAEASGGLAKIKAMSAPYGNIMFMPTGGINAMNLTSYLDYNKILACGGSWMVDNAVIASGDFDKITALTKEAVTSMLGFEVAHIGINNTNEAEAQEHAAAFSSMFGFEKKNGTSSVFASNRIELLKTAAKGTHGHIAIRTNYIDRAIYYLEKQGISLDYTSVKKDAMGRLTVIYMQDEFGGFAVHLLQK
jgi:2-dehydro-3-deoxyphosphogluconate aldolase/(4S)-4-hydroxy-2-oxoglutarate aldolase